MPSKKNSRKAIHVHGRTIFIPNQVYDRWHKQAMLQLLGSKPVSGVSEVSITIYSQTKRKADLINKAESVMDLLVDAGILPDDNWWVVPKVTLLFGGMDSKKPRAEVEIH